MSGVSFPRFPLLPVALEGSAVAPWKPAGPTEEQKAKAESGSESQSAEGKDAKPAAPSQGETLRKEVAELQDKVKSKKQELLLSLADFENTKKRFSKEREARNRGATTHFAKKMVETYVEFNALTAAGEAGSGELSEAGQSFHEGIVLTRDLYRTTMARFGVEQFTVEPGQPLVLSRHESVGTVEDAGLAANTVAEVVQPGFTLEPGASVLRKARVKTAAAPSE